jgi:DNA-binding Lrp family transcriptional regulator
VTKAYLLIRTSVPYEPTHSQKVDHERQGPGFSSLRVIESLMKIGGVVEASRILQTSGIKDLFDVVAIVEAEDAAAIRRIVAEQIQPIHGVRWTNTAIPI